ncbi:MAG: hypothetical protein PHX49_02875 [Bacteroidales bacterium]|nr:hypothetical protein [Bacteroidales bacterium]
MKKHLIAGGSSVKQIVDVKKRKEAGPLIRIQSTDQQVRVACQQIAQLYKPRPGL